MHIFNLEISNFQRGNIYQVVVSNSIHMKHVIQRRLTLPNPFMTNEETAAQKEKLRLLRMSVFMTPGWRLLAVTPARKGEHCITTYFSTGLLMF